MAMVAANARTRIARNVRPINKPQRDEQLPLSELSPERLEEIFKMREHYEPILMNARSVDNKLWLLWHAAYLETFCRQAPYCVIPTNIVVMLAKALGESRSAKPLILLRRMTFYAHAEKVRNLLGYRKLSSALRISILAWITELAKRNDDHDHLRQLLDERLRADKIVIPAQYRIERLLSKAHRLYL
jgi:hypothetical protein